MLFVGGAIAPGVGAIGPDERQRGASAILSTSAGQATRRSYRWLRPPTWESSMTFPISGRWTLRDRGASLLSDKWVLER